MYIKIVKQHTSGYKVNGMLVLAASVREALATYLCISDAGSRIITK